MGQRPRPVQQPHPPIWIGGSGKPALRRVAQLGDGWIPQATPLDQLGADIATIIRAAHKARPGAVPEIGYHLLAHVGDPTWELPKGVLFGKPQRIIDFANERLGAIGVSHLQVRLLARSAEEQCDQIAAFGAEVGPHLTRTDLVLRTVMPILAMRHDFRAPVDGPVSSREIYAAALEQFAWADQHGFTSLVLSEHHGVADGWCPAPLTIAAAVLARTQHARVMISASVLPLHDPIRIAEQITVHRQHVPGRLWVVVRRGLPRRGVRDGRARARGTRSHPRRTRRDRAASVAGRAVRVARPRRVCDSEAGHRPAAHAVRRRGCSGRGTARSRACASRCFR